MRFSFGYTDHLVALVAEVSADAARIAAADPAARSDAADAAARERARLSLRLDASPIDDETAEAVDRGAWQRPAQLPAADAVRSGGWASALKLDGMATQDVAAVEYANLRAAHAAEASLAEALTEEPLETLARLHGHICEGLVAPDVIGRPRRTAQAVHDGAQGRVIFNAPDPDLLPGLLQELAAWLRGGPTPRGQHPGSMALPAVVVAGIVAERLLEWQPYEAANGRVARSAAAIILRARGADPYALAVPERVFARQPGRYVGEIAATQRRRADLTPWVEYTAEAVAAGLRTAVATLSAGPPIQPAERAEKNAAEIPEGATVTVTEYATRFATSRETALADLTTLAAAGRMTRDPGTRGMRFRRA